LPLHKLTRKDAPKPFILTDEARASFTTLRDAFTTAPLLRHFDPTLPLTLYTDAPDFALSGILHRPDDHGLLHPIGFFSRKLSPAEINYEIYDKELLAVVESFKHFRTWTIGTKTPISVFSDHKNLEYFMASRVLNRRQARWSLFLSEFHFELDRAPGTQNPSNPPSRRSDYVPKKGDDVLKVMHHTILNADRTRRLFTPLDCPGTKVSAFETFTFPAPELLQRFKTAFQNDLEWRTALKNGDTDFMTQDSLVFHCGKLFVPEKLRPTILKRRHDDVIAGHPGRARTTEFILQDHSWPKARRYIRDYVSSCEVCQRIKEPRHKPYGPLQPLDIPDQPRKSISTDLTQSWFTEYVHCTKVGMSQLLGLGFRLSVQCAEEYVLSTYSQILSA